MAHSIVVVDRLESFVYYLADADDDRLNDSAAAAAVVIDLAAENCSCYSWLEPQLRRPQQFAAAVVGV